MLRVGAAPAPSPTTPCGCCGWPGSARRPGSPWSRGHATGARADAARVWDAPGERLADELGRIVRLPRPDRAFAAMDAIGVLGALVPQLEESRGLDQSPYHHKDVLGHTLEVVTHVTELCADPEAVFRGRAGRVAEVLAAPLADELTARDALMLTGPPARHGQARDARGHARGARHVHGPRPPRRRDGRRR